MCEPTFTLKKNNAARFFFFSFFFLDTCTVRMQNIDGKQSGVAKSFGEPQTQEMAGSGVAAHTAREGTPGKFETCDMHIKSFGGRKLRLIDT